MKKLGITVALGLTLAGCVSTGNEEYARVHAGVKQAQAVCHAGKFSSRAAYGQCLANAEAPLASIEPNPDLQRLFTAQRAAIFERMDRGQLTQTQATAELAQLNSAIASESQRRNNANLAVAAQQRAASAASDAALAASRPVTCYRMAYLVNCL